MVEVTLTDIAGPSHIIKRPRLTKILDETEARIILLCAPAGYGKTTLAREWVATRREPVFWYSGGPAMADVAALAVDLAELFAGSDGAPTERVRLLAKRSEPPRRLAKEIAALGTQSGSLLVIDDYQRSTESNEADEFVRELVTASAFRVLITSREAPPWIDSRTIVYGHADLLSAAELALTQSEAAAVLPNPREVIELTRGWPALIGLTAMRGEIEGIEAGLTPTELYDFIASELYENTDHLVRDQLVALAVGADASPIIAETVITKEPVAIAKIACSSGFATRAQDGWISIHPLLRAFLLSHSRSLDPDGVIASRCVEALRARLMWDDCFAVLDRVPDGSATASVLRDALCELIDSGRTTTVERWIDMAETHGFDDPIFRLARAEVALRRGRVVESIALAADAARLLNGDLAARAYLTAARAAHQSDDPETSFMYASQAEQRAEAVALRTEALWVALANAFEGAPDRIGDAAARLNQVKDPRPEHGARRVCADMFLIMASPNGSHRDALRLAEQLVALSSRVQDPLLRTNALNIYAHLLRTTAAYDRAIEASEALCREAERTGLDFAVDYALLCQAASFVGIRAIGAAKEVIRRLESREPSRHVLANLAIVKARQKIVAGDLDGASVILSHEPALPTLGVQGEFHAFSAMVHAACGRSDEAALHLAKASAAPRMQYAEVAANVAAAMAVANLPNAGSAANYVRDAFNRGHCDVLVAACRAFPQLAANAVSGGAGTTLECLFSASNDVDLGRRVGLPMHREYRRKLGLSPREGEVCELVVAGRSNAEIAATLFISESTVKVHVKHIFEKLGVHTRAEAAAITARLRPDRD